MEKSLKGYLMTFGSFIIWGVLPLYWKSLDSFNSFEILSHRILWSFILLLLIAISLKRTTAIKAIFKTKNQLITLIGSSVLITVNWVLFIYSVNSGYTVQCSLGYYINPLINVLLGMLFFRERLDGFSKIAVCLAAFGVLYLTFGYGSFPIISIMLALSFGFYGMLKKKLAMDSINSLFVETLFISPLALGYLMFLEVDEHSTFLNNSWTNDLMFLFSGIATTFPLFLYNEGAKLIPYSTVGFIQYLAPTFMLFIGVYFFNEPFTQDHLISFTFIWSALLVYSIGKVNDLQRQRKLRKQSM